jgi:hypothetical protein
VARHAIEAEPVPPKKMKKIMVRDFEVSPSSITDNASPLHRLINLFRQGSTDEHRLEIGHGVVASLSEQTLKRLNKSGLEASRIPSDKNVSRRDDILLVTGSVSNADEGDRLTRTALGCGAGESSLDTKVMCSGWPMVSGLRY